MRASLSLFRTFLLVIALPIGLGLHAMALAIQVCELNGEHVNPANGHTTNGKTGLISDMPQPPPNSVRAEPVEAQCRALRTLRQAQGERTLAEAHPSTGSGRTDSG